MAREKDPLDVTATIRRSIEVSPKGSRKVRFHRLRDQFGFQAWSAQRKELVARLFADQGIIAQPPIGQAGPEDWVLLSLPRLPPPRDDSPEPRPTAAWFEHLMSVHLGSEREVEMHFASPLFHALGYDDEHEAAGFRVERWEGVHRETVEADLIYFADGHQTLEEGKPLILVECKSPGRPPDAGTGQVKSYAYWVKPAYYVLTNGNVVVVYNYQGGAVPDVKVLEVKRPELRERFDELYSLLNPKAAAAARQGKIDKLTRPVAT